MTAVVAKRHRLDPAHRGERQRRVEMREERAAARGLEAQRCSELCGIDRDQEEIVASGEVLRCRLGGLCGGREMDEAVAQIDSLAAINAGLIGRSPFLSSADLEDKLHRSSRSRKHRLDRSSQACASYHGGAECESDPRGRVTGKRRASVGERRQESGQRRDPPRVVRWRHHDHHDRQLRSAERQSLAKIR